MKKTFFSFLYLQEKYNFDSTPFETYRTFLSNILLQMRLYKL